MHISIQVLFERLLRHHGPQAWWPADNPFEVIIGAVLVQRTRWHNAALAIAALRERELLSTSRLIAATETTVQACVKPAGFYRTKATRLKMLAQFVNTGGGIAGLRQLSTRELRQRLLALKGIGPETADVILLYAFERSVAVVDEYLRRLWRRLHAASACPNDDELRRIVFAELPRVADLNELHALVVANGKEVCRKTPACHSCCLRDICKLGKQVTHFDQHRVADRSGMWASSEN